jgi:hypothetical protein
MDNSTKSGGTVGLQEHIDESVNESSYEMDRWKIREAIAESGKMSLKDVMNYLNFRYEGKFDVKLAKEDAKEMIKDAKKHM